MYIVHAYIYSHTSNENSEQLFHSWHFESQHMYYRTKTANIKPPFKLFAFNLLEFSRHSLVIHTRRTMCAMASDECDRRVYLAVLLCTTALYYDRCCIYAVNVYANNCLHWCYANKFQPCKWDRVNESRKDGRGERERRIQFTRKTKIARWNVYLAVWIISIVKRERYVFTISIAHVLYTKLSNVFF